MQQYTVKQSTHLNADTLLLTLRPKHMRDRLMFYPGQYIAIGFKRFGRPSPMRCFSIVSSPNANELQVAARVQGKFTRSLAALLPGDDVFVRGPFGNFVIDETYDRSVLLIAGGIGITPFMSMIRFATETQLSVPITLLFSYRGSDAPFLAELRSHERQNPNFRLALRNTNASSRQAGEPSGRITDAHLEQLTGGHFSKFTYFMCGPKAFVRSMRDLLGRHGADPSRMISEEFSPTSPANAVASAPQHTIPRWTYALTGVGLIAAASFFLALDVDRALEKTVKAAPAAQQSQPDTPMSTSSTSKTDTTGGSSANTQPSTTYSQPTMTYRQPVTSVS